ncbi:MAG: hypothetical protein ACKVP9_09170 [Burkholderiales bacterium]
MYESRKQSPLPRALFIRRVVAHFTLALVALLASLAAGMAGYMHYENLDWRDAFVNAAMLLGGMGPVDAPKTDGGKVFAGLYALYCGLLILITAGVVLAPVLHRILHKFHWSEDR